MLESTLRRVLGIVAVFVASAMSIGCAAWALEPVRPSGRRQRRHALLVGSVVLLKLAQSGF